MRTAPALLTVLAVCLALTGCVPDDDPIVLDPEPSVSPIFESDEEALAAAEEAYGAYLAVVDQIRMDGGSNANRLEEVATDPVLSSELAGFAELVTRGHRTVGLTSYDTVSLQQFDRFASVAVVLIYVCEDFTAVDVVDADGVSVVGADRQLRWPLVVGFDSNAGTLKVSTVDDWTGEDFCV